MAIDTTSAFMIHRIPITLILFPSRASAVYSTRPLKSLQVAWLKVDARSNEIAQVKGHVVLVGWC
ncbi:unnamed protein product [Brugia pahangi]|uniref:Secreted protein n=1 Tax=Brugia pahangi TaxID=6280 RepID=A0A0N4TSD0_BRUPA|nr:unnamed protein product [Brugia pahangi]